MSDEGEPHCNGQGCAAINKRKRLFVCRCGMPGRIEKFFDADGDETEDLELAKVAIIQFEDGGWTWQLLSDFEPATVN